jgi:hypothetical protein
MVRRHAGMRRGENHAAIKRCRRPGRLRGALNGQGPNLGQGLREPPPQGAGYPHPPLNRSTTTSVNTHGLRPASPNEAVAGAELGDRRLEDGRAERLGVVADDSLQLPATGGHWSTARWRPSGAGPARRCEPDRSRDGPGRRRPPAARSARWSGSPSAAPGAHVAAGSRAHGGPAAASSGRSWRGGSPWPDRQPAHCQAQRRSRTPVGHRYRRSSCVTATPPRSLTWPSGRRRRRRSASVGAAPRRRYISGTGQTSTPGSAWAPSRPALGRGTW